MQRIEVLQYLDASLKWKDNPVRTEVIAGLVQFIEQGQPGKQSSPDERKAIYGDQITAFVSLREHEPEEAARLRDAGIKKKIGFFCRSVLPTTDGGKGKWELKFFHVSSW